MRALQWVAVAIFGGAAGFMLTLFWTALDLPPSAPVAALLVFGLLWLFNELRNAPLEEQDEPDETGIITHLYLIRRRSLYRHIQADTMRAIADYRRKAQAREQGQIEA
jgi:hypothetical protein